MKLPYDTTHAYNPSPRCCDHYPECHPPQALVDLLEKGFEVLQPGLHDLQTGRYVPHHHCIRLWRPGQHVLLYDRKGLVEVWLRFEPWTVDVNGPQFLHVALGNGAEGRTLQSDLIEDR